MGYKSIGKRLQMAREEVGYNQEQLAAKIGCSQSTLSNYEKGKRRIYLAQLDKIAQVLNKPIEYFLQPVDSYTFGTNLPRSPEPNVHMPFGNSDEGVLPLRSKEFGATTSVAVENNYEEELLACYRALSSEGQRLALDFIAWLKTKEVNGNG